MDPINETGVTFGWTFERRARPPFGGDLEIIPKPRQDVTIRYIDWPRAFWEAVNRPRLRISAMIRGEEPPPRDPLVTTETFPGRYEPPNVVITVEKGSRGYIALFAMRVEAFNAKYRDLDRPDHPDYAPPPFPKFDMQFMLGGKRCKLKGCFVLSMLDGETASRVSISTDLFDDGSGLVRLVGSSDFEIDEQAEN